MAEPVAELCIYAPKKIVDELERVAKENGVTVNDLILRAIDKVLEEMRV